MQRVVHTPNPTSLIVSAKGQMTWLLVKSNLEVYHLLQHKIYANNNTTNIDQSNDGQLTKSF